MAEKINAHRGRQSRGVGEMTPEIFMQRIERIDKRVAYLSKGKRVPSHLREPKWVDKTIDKISAMELPLKGKSPEFCKGAYLGNQLASERHALAVFEAHNPHKAAELLSHKQLANAFGRNLAGCIHNVLKFLMALPLPALAEFTEGLAYGIKCKRHRIECGAPIQENPRLPILETIVRYQENVQYLANQKKTVAEISDFIAKRLPQPQRKTYGDSFIGIKGKKTGAWFAFVNRIYKLCKEIGIDNFPKRGRPGRK
jgi:hypothetical protein